MNARGLMAMLIAAGTGACVGAQGDPGAAGDPGPQGQQGAMGDMGTTGQTGMTGMQGPGAVKVRYVNTAPAATIQTPTTIATLGNVSLGANCTVDGAGTVSTRMYLTTAGSVSIQGRVSWQFDDTGSYGTGTMLFLTLTGTDQQIDQAAVAVDHSIRAINGPIFIDQGAASPLLVLNYEAFTNATTTQKCVLLGTLLVTGG